MKVYAGVKSEQPNLKRCRQYFDLFASTTVIRGFSFIKLSKWWSERIFWSLLVIGLFALTANDVVNSVNKFQSEPTRSQTKIRKNSSIFLKDPIFRFTVDLKSFRYQLNLSDSQLTDQFLDLYSFANITQLFSDHLNHTRNSNVHSTFTDESEFYQQINAHDTSITNEPNFLTLLHAAAIVVTSLESRIHLVSPNSLKTLIAITGD